MLAQNNRYINEASETIYQLTRDEKVRLQCEAREDYYRRQRSWDDRIAKAKKIEAEHDRLTTDNDRLTTDNDRLTTENAELKDTIEELTATITRQDTTIQELTVSFAALKTALEANGITLNV